MFNLSYAACNVPKSETLTTTQSDDEDQVSISNCLSFIQSFDDLQSQGPQNIFDQLPALVKLKANHACDELDTYLASDVEDVEDALKWWYEHRSNYPHLTHMALDYLTIPSKVVFLATFLLLNC